MTGHAPFLLLCCVCMVTSLMAGEKKPRNKTGKPALTQSVEQKLQAPAQLNLRGREQIAVGELLQQLREKHGLNIRVDRSAVKLLTLILEEGLVPADDVATWRPAARPAPSATPVYTASGLLPVTAQPIDSSPSPAEYNASTYPTSRQSSQPSLQHEYSPQHERVGAIHYPPHFQYLPASPVSQDAKLGPPAQALITDSREAILTAKTERKKAPADAAEPPETDEPAPPEQPGVHFLGAAQAYFQRSLLLTDSLQDENLTVEEVLRAALEQMATPLDMSEELAGLPVAYSHAYDWDLLTIGNTVYITTRMQANLHKVVRVYQVPSAVNLTSGELSEVIRRSIRPWSWRTQINDIIGQIKMDWPEGAALPPECLSQLSLVLSGGGAPVTLNGNSDLEGNANASPAATPDPQASILAMKAFGQLLTSSAVAGIQGMISGAEMMHYADPPTATIEAIPGLLVICQSQSAHREIAELLSQLQDASQPRK